MDLVNLTKISQKIKTNKLVEYRKNIKENEEKHIIIIIKKYFNLKNFAS